MLKNNRTLSFSAASVFAVVALGSTPVMAQETAPVIDLPPSAGVPPAAVPVAQPPVAVARPPMVVLPEAGAPVAPVAVQSPAPAEVGEPAPGARASAAPARRAAAPARETAASEPVASAAPASPVNDTVAPEAIAPIAAAPVAAAPAPVPATPAEPVERETGLGAEAGLLALLAALGLGGAGLVAARSRRRRADMTDEEAAMVEAAAVGPAMPLAATPVLPAYSMYEPEHEPDPAAPAHAGPVEMPAGPIPRGEERDQLLRRMIAAEPDEANPFRSRKARLRRARLILQRMEQEREAGGGEAGFDWRTYRPSSTAAPVEPVTA